MLCSFCVRPHLPVAILVWIGYVGVRMLAPRLLLPLIGHVDKPGRSIPTVAWTGDKPYTRITTWIHSEHLRAEDGTLPATQLWIVSIGSNSRHVGRRSRCSRVPEAEVCFLNTMDESVYSGYGTRFNRKCWIMQVDSGLHNYCALLILPIQWLRAQQIAAGVREHM